MRFLVLLPLSVWCAAFLPARAANDRAAPEWITAQVRAPQVQQCTFVSAAAGTKVSYHLYTPEAYKTEPARRFPVIYWLHGSGGGLRGIAPLAAHFDAAIRAGKLPPVIVVFPNGLAESMWCDSPDGRAPMETVVIKELIPHIDATHRTLATRAGRLIEGFSMGGYGSARLGLKHPELFCAVSLLGAGPLQQEFDPDDTPRSEPAHAQRLFAQVWGGEQTRFKAQSPWELAGQHAAAKSPPPLLMRQVVGDRDGTLANNRRFDARLTALKIPHTFTVLPGVGHNTRAVFAALGEANWKFYRAAFEGVPAVGKP
ncbi:MAG: esterase family protein [Opitutae bacterium]|nr:esterase family protein [Opitutae bacterium]